MKKATIARQLKHRLARAINVTQRGNESRIPSDITQFPVSLENVRRYAKFIVAPFFP